MKNIFIGNPPTREIERGRYDTGVYCAWRGLDEYLAKCKMTREDFLVEVAKRNREVIAIDLMCGFGRAVSDLNSLKNVTAYGIDRIYYGEWEANPKRFIRADVADMSFIKPKSVDFIFCFFGLSSYLDNPKKAFRESLRILAPGGTSYYYAGCYSCLMSPQINANDFRFRYAGESKKASKRCTKELSKALIVSRKEN